MSIRRIKTKYSRLFKTHILRDKFLLARRQWSADEGDSKLRFDYPLDENSVVFDVGGYLGDFADTIYNRYKCRVYVFEPVVSFYDIICQRFKDNDKIFVYNFGLSDRDGVAEISLEDNGSSVYRASGPTTSITLKSISQFLESSDINNIDLMKMNIEGGEFDILPDLIEKGYVGRIDNLQIQFHDVFSDAEIKRDGIREALKRTHTLEYDYWFIWESWKRKALPPQA
jgi:FkbM family methyltransferase